MVSGSYPRNSHTVLFSRFSLETNEFVATCFLEYPVMTHDHLFCCQTKLLMRRSHILLSSHRLPSLYTSLRLHTLFGLQKLLGLVHSIWFIQGYLVCANYRRPS
jgi:hypothetical protein